MNRALFYRWIVVVATIMGCIGYCRQYSWALIPAFIGCFCLGALVDDWWLSSLLPSPYTKRKEINETINTNIHCH
jgi:hypothetical protein